MPQDALDFERILSNPKDAQGQDITWRNVAALDGFIRRLNEVRFTAAARQRFSPCTPMRSMR